MNEVFSARRGGCSGPGWGRLREPRLYRFEYYPNSVSVYSGKERLTRVGKLVLILASYAKSPTKVIHTMTLPYRQAKNAHAIHTHTSTQVGREGKGK